MRTVNSGATPSEASATAEASAAPAAVMPPVAGCPYDTLGVDAVEESASCVITRAVSCEPAGTVAVRGAAPPTASESPRATLATALEAPPSSTTDQSDASSVPPGGESKVTTVVVSEDVRAAKETGE